jgi:multiple sugar transport system permease protein
MLQMGEPAITPLVNSLIIAGGATALATVVGMFYAYGLSRYRAAGQGSFFFILMFRMIPPVAIVVPLLIAYATLKLIDTHLGMILLYGAVTLPYVIWLLKSFFDEIPREIDEAAILDGCSLFGAFFKGVMPLARAGLAVAALFVFILDWSEFFAALIITRSAAVTLPVRMATMSTSMGILYGPLAAVGVLAIIPPLVFGIMIQKYLVRGFTFGAIKGR